MTRMRILCLPAKGCPFFQQLAYHGHLTDNCLINTVIPETTTRGEWMIRGQRWPILPTVRERRAPTTRSEGDRAKPHRQRDLVVRGEETFPPRLALAAARHLREQTQA